MRITAFILLSILIGCSTKTEDEKLNARSISIHNAMVKQAHEMETQLRLMKSDSLSQVNKDSIDVVVFALEQWESDLVEVPGNENHDHSEHHHHDHSNSAEAVTALQMLQIQQELDKRLQKISNRTRDLLNNSQ